MDATQKFYTPPSETDIRSFAERFLGTCTERGGELIADICPFCQGGPSQDQRTFYLSLATGQFICHRAHCGRKGGFPSLLRHFNQPVKFNSVSKSYSVLNITPHPRTAEIDRYFASRGISTMTLDAYQVSSDGRGNILWPFYVEGELVYAKYRKPHPPLPRERKEWQEPGAMPVLLGMDLCSAGSPLVICEASSACSAR